MKLSIATAALIFVTIPVIAQDARSGVSTPPASDITATDDNSPATPVLTPRVPEAKPSAAVPADSSNTNTITYGPYVPYRAAGDAAPGTAPTDTSATTAAFDPDANIVTTTVPDTSAAADSPSDDEGIVTSVPEREGEIREGTLLRARITQGLSTTSTLEGSPFSASLTQPVEKDGRVILPIGSIVEGRVTEVRSGRRISGRAALHLEAHDVTLPDGSHYVIHAQLIDTDQTDHSTVNREGTLVRRDHPKETLAAMSVATGGAAAAGAMVGGGVGALVGAGIGAGASTIIWLKQDRQEALPKDSLLVFSLTTPMILKPLSNNAMSGNVTSDNTVSSVAAPQPASYTAVASVPVQ
ncbi:MULTISPECIES: hypothetical protein [Acidobacteriaceae]|uniref:hypothetical protein n=1 Tax=Acidobacteriaceae TaxID=204434 RepID=UPI00131CA5FF|nr:MULTISPECIES: hypothetical protein [Acidobacteriaceae]MDW5266001.1 hypothetical protein [Edaphobacter sp.]